MAILYCWSGATGTATGADWTNAKTTLTAAFTTEVAGDTIFVAHDHVETQATNLTLTSSGTILLPTFVICVNRAGSVPPLSADRRATAQVTTTGASAISLAGFAHYDGFIFSVGTGATGVNFVIPSSAQTWLRLDNCSIRFGGTGVCTVQVATLTGNGGYIELNNTTMSFGNVSSSVNITGVLKWRNTPLAIIGASIPTILFKAVVGTGGELECIGVDFSALGSGKTLVNNSGGDTSNATKFRFIDCKLDAAVIKSMVPLSLGGMEVDFLRCGPAT